MASVCLYHQRQFYSWWQKKNFEVQNILMMNGRNRMVGKGNRWSWEREQWKNLSIGERDTDKVIKL